MNTNPLNRFIVLFILIALITVRTNSQTSITLLPSEVVAPIFSASPTAHRMSFEKIFEINHYFGSIGTHRPIAATVYDKIPVEFGLGASMHTTLRKSPGHWQVIETGFFIDLLVDAEVVPGTIIRFGRGHTSQHLSDDAFELLGYTKSVNYTRDYFKLFGIQQVPLLKGFVYGGIIYNFIFRIDSVRVDTWMLQFGGEFLNIQISPNLYFYSGADLLIHHELNDGTSQNYQAGIKYELQNKRALRFAYNHRTGLEYRGQFFRERNTMNTLGLYVDF